MDNFDHIYANVPADQRERLRQFRQQYPVKTTSVNGLEWEYVSNHVGERVVLLLVGGLRVADAGFRAFMSLDADFRVIAPNTMA
jgi:hypothetical protein